jgi:histidyl-tRNA synthetase
MISTYERNYKKPVKWFAIPQLFRYEKHQRGRLREHFQFNADIIGETDAAADAELIALLIDTLRSFGLTVEDFVIRLSSRQAWHEFFVANHGDPAKEYEFFQVIDKLERTEPAENGEKLHAIGFTLEVVNAFIEKAEPTADLRPIVENLAARGMSSFVRIDYRVIRGLAYYTGPVFEAFDKKGDCPRAIAGGGRYDNLVQLISSGKVNLPSLGFGMGDVVLRDLLEARNLLPAFDAGIDVYCIVAHEELRPVTLRLVQDLRLAGLAVDYSLTPAKPDKQFKRAQELKAGYVAQVLRAETGEVLAKVKNLQTRQEVQVAPGEVIESIKKA